MVGKNSDSIRIESAPCVHDSLLLQFVCLFIFFSICSDKERIAFASEDFIYVYFSSFENLNFSNLLFLFRLSLSVSSAARSFIFVLLIFSHEQEDSKPSICRHSRKFVHICIVGIRRQANDTEIRNAHGTKPKKTIETMCLGFGSEKYAAPSLFRLQCNLSIFRFVSVCFGHFCLVALFVWH